MASKNSQCSADTSAGIIISSDEYSVKKKNGSQSVPPVTQGNVPGGAQLPLR